MSSTIYAAPTSSVPGTAHTTHHTHTQMVRKPRRHSRSNSYSSASIVTAKRPGSIASSNTSSRNSVVHARPQSPALQDVISSARTSRPDQIPEERELKRRKSEVNELAFQQSQPAENQRENLHRWSHSTSSSISSIGQTRRYRSNSGAVADPYQQAPRILPGTINHSPRYDPQSRVAAFRSDDLRRPSSPPSPGATPGHTRRANASLTALPAMQMTALVPESNGSSPPDISQSSATPYGLSERDANAYGAGGMDGSSPQRPKDRPRTKSGNGSSKDKKTMLSQALQQANTAVLLDNAQNFEGALDAYRDACNLLQQVMDRTTGAEDRHKLDVIRVTYSNRIEELGQMALARSSTEDEKHLPARPISVLSIDPVLTQHGVDGRSGQGGFTASPTSPVKTPTADFSLLATSNPSSNTSQPMVQIRDQSSGYSNFFDFGDGKQTVFDTSPNLELFGGNHGLAQTTNAVEPPLSPQDRYMPAPLSLRRDVSPQPASSTQQDTFTTAPEHIGQALDDDRPESSNSASWLNTIDESDSSDADSVHSVSSQRGVRRKHIRGLSIEADPDFDVAFDAAVEAAYNEGFEPDLDAQRKRLTAYRDELPSQTTPTAKFDIQNPAALQSSDASLDTETDDEAEERILSEMTQDFAQGFNFDLRSKSALPRQSDSSGYSRSTWQSSQASGDRTTAASSLSTVAEGGLASQFARTTPRIDEMPLPLPTTTPPAIALPAVPSNEPSNPRNATVRSRRLSGHLTKPLKIETAAQPDTRKRASTIHNATSPFNETTQKVTTKPLLQIQSHLPPPLLSAASDPNGDRHAHSAPALEVPDTLDDATRPATAMGFRPSYEADRPDARGVRPTIFRKNKSSISLREHTGHTLLLASPELKSPMVITPMSSTFMSTVAKRDQNLLAAQRAHLPSFMQTTLDGQRGNHLFDTSLTSDQPLQTPRSPDPSKPYALEPCPEPVLLRPFWIMRALSAILTHPRGGYITTRLFVPRQVWYTKGVKLRMIEDKIANCDTLTAALGRLANVDTYDADAVMEELQSFESVMERVQTVLTKKLGSDVGVQGALASFRDAPVSSAVPAMPAPSTLAGGSLPPLPTADSNATDRSAKSNSGKSYLSSWRKLRNKSSGAPLNSHHASSTAPGAAGNPSHHTMPSVPMTDFVPVERRGMRRDARTAIFDGPHKDYMESLARLFEGVQILDQIARQVEDPGLKHSSPTHVGLELSIRHAAEFFGFYVCRFVLADLGTLVDKYVKRGSEWVLA